MRKQRKLLVGGSVGVGKVFKILFYLSLLFSGLTGNKSVWSVLVSDE